MRAAVYDRAAPEGIRLDPSRARPDMIYGGALANVPRGHVVVRVAAAGCNPVDAKHVFGDKLPRWCSGRAEAYCQGKIK